MIFYNILLNILFLPVILILLVFSVFNIRLRTTLLPRIGFFRIKKFKKRPIWFHCSSLGEFNAIKNVILELKKEYDEIFLTALTDTGFEAAQEFLSGKDASILPLDFNFLIRRFIKQVNPLLLIIEETEVWPNLIFQAEQLKIPVMYTNCIMAERSYRFYRRLGFIFKKILNGIDIFFIQNSRTGQYLSKLGIRNKKIRYIGNIKFDLNIKIEKNAERIKKALNLTSRLIITCGSTRKGEEEIWLKIFKDLKKNYSNLKLVIVPRHLNRINEIADLIKRNGLDHSLYSKIKKDYDVLLVDKMGVLQDMYLISDISFIGGTLVPAGGHNPLEAANVRKPILCGKYTKNNEEAFRKIIENKGGISIDDPERLFDILRKMLKNRSKLKVMGKNAYKVLKDNQGASKRIVQYLMENYVNTKIHH